MNVLPVLSKGSRVVGTQMCLSAVAKAEMLTQLSLFSICRGSSWADLCVALVANAK